MNMTILQRDDDITHVVLAGRLDTTGAEEIDASFSAATAARGQPAVVDLSEIEFMASRGIGLLISNGKRLMKAGHKMVLLNPQGLVGSVLRTSRVDKVLPVAYDLDEAIRILRGVPGPAVAASPRLQAPADESRPPRAEPVPTAPSTIQGQLRLAIKNELSELKGLYVTLAQFLDAHHVPQRAAYAVNLAIDELVTNVMRYAYVDFDTHFIDIALDIEEQQAILRIVDDGRPFDPRTGPALDLHAEEREAGGLGLLLVLDMVDVLNYRRGEEKNCVEVRVHLLAGDEHADLSEAKGAAAEASDE
jgi:serine/threonine-protein kinase RsbW